MGDDLASANVNRSYSLAAMSLAIFTFLLFFLYPRFRSDEIDPWMFQATLIIMGVATFSFVFSSFHYYCASLGTRFNEVETVLYQQRADRLWLIGYTLLFFVPSLILVTIGLYVVAASWFALWLAYVVLEICYFPRIQGAHRNSSPIK